MESQTECVRTIEVVNPWPEQQYGEDESSKNQNNDPINLFTGFTTHVTDLKQTGAE